MLIMGYAMSRPLPDIEVQTARLMPHALFALAIVALILWAVAAGRLDFAAIVAAFCAGNRGRASGFAPSG